MPANRPLWPFIASEQALMNLLATERACSGVNPAVRSASSGFSEISEATVFRLLNRKCGSVRARNADSCASSAA